tara:strand:- start:548 stop:1480 length:933 start_codon:yes stop_codon:yes gene_type:complete
MRKIITIVGTTASGKTNLAIQLSHILDAEVISLDSRQIFKGMAIGTAQPTNKERDGVMHHLIGFTNPWDPVSAGRYAELVSDKVSSIHKRGKIPIICGGAGLYYRAIKSGLFSKSSTDKSIRHELESAYDKNPSQLMDELIKIDPEYASIVHINNKKRLVRALEIFGITGKAPSENFDEQKNNPTKVLDLFTIRLDWERRSLIKRIEHRLDQMLVSGWVAEVEGLLKLQKEKSSLFPALNSIGYEQIQSYLENDIDFDKMKETIFVKTRQFAKRQSQWFNKEDIELTLKMDTLKKDEVAQILCDLFKTMI